MNIIGPDYLVFGVDDIAASIEYLTAFGLKPVDVTEQGGLFEALDGTGVVIRHKSDPALPPPLPTSNMLRQQVYGVRASEDLDAIEAELSKDRRVTRLADGSIETKDDQGFELKFQVTKRREINMPPRRSTRRGLPRSASQTRSAYGKKCPPRRARSATTCSSFRYRSGRELLLQSPRLCHHRRAERCWPVPAAEGQ